LKKCNRFHNRNFFEYPKVMELIHYFGNDGLQRILVTGKKKKKRIPFCYFASTQKDFIVPCILVEGKK